jgi:tetratricopeptide (TPR) repeat protein
MFVFLALVFALGFVFFGVGSGSSIGDLLQGNFDFGGSSGASVSSLQKKVQKNPKDAASWLKLSQAYQSKGDTEKAIDPLKHYIVLRPKDTSALATLVSLQQTRALGLAQQAYNTQTTGGSLVTDPAGGLNSKSGPVVNDPIEQAVQTKVSSQQSTLTTQATTAFKETEQSLKKLAAATPDDTSTLFQYAQIAQYAGDTGVAIAQYKKFLKLAPDDPKATVAKQQLKALAPPAGSSSNAQSGSGTGG